MKGLSLFFFTFIVFVINTSCSVIPSLSKGGTDVSPYSYGLAQARTGVERYNALLKAHSAALKLGVNVDYTGIDTLKLEIPQKPIRIPLTAYNDFKGCVFIINNTSKDTYLFEKITEGTPIVVDGRLIDLGNFQSVDLLNKGKALLIVEDNKPWVVKRKGYSYGHVRKDILLIKNGRAMNTVTMPYNNVHSSPKCSYIKLDSAPLVIKNLTIEREPGCTFVTNISLISGFDDVRISNVRVHTPTNTLKDDRGIFIKSCTNVFFDNVRIEGTYSQLDHSGYGVYLDNIWNFKATHMYGKANWGIFGNNNINVASIEDSQINRFDIHCYGRDISFKNVEFFDLYNQFSSVYGTIWYDQCLFTDFVPVLNGGSYNAFVGHEVVIQNCIFNASKKNNNLIKISKFGTDVNERSEMSVKALPNVHIKNLKVNLINGADYFYLFYINSSAKNVDGVGYLSDISIDGMTVVIDDVKQFKGMALSNVPLKTAAPVVCKVQNVKVQKNGVAVKSSPVNVNGVLLKANLPLKGGKMLLHNAGPLHQ